MIKDDVLIFKFSLLSKLIVFGNFGVNVKFIVKFNKGVDWNLNIIMYDMFVLSDVIGIIDFFVILIMFNGNQLVMMEVIYVIGGNVGL